MTVDFACRKVAFRLAWIGAGLMAIAVALPLLAFFFAGKNVDTVNFRQFDLRSVGNFLVLYTSALFALAAVLVLPIARLETDRRDRLAWRGLTAIFVYLALDETVRLRDSFDHLHVAAFERSALLSAHPSLWIYAIAVIAVAFVYRRFIRRQPRVIAIGLVLGGALYAIGSPGAAIVAPFREVPIALDLDGGIVNLLLGLLGQSLRMAGALTLTWGLLRELERSRLTVEIDIGVAPAGEAVKRRGARRLNPAPSNESRHAA